MQKHEWKVETEEGRRYYRAYYHASRWTFSTTLKTDPDWQEDIEPTKELLLELREILWGKYQRRRCTWKIVRTVDVLLEKNFGVTPPQQP